MTYKKYHYIVLVFIINIFMVSSCTTLSNSQSTYSSKNLYKTAHQKLSHKCYKEAIQDLLNLQKSHLLDPCSQQIHLDLIYAYYKAHDLKSANDSILHFLRLYPNHNHLDYILYMHGIINMSLDKKNTIPIKYLNNKFNNNPIYAKTAFLSFRKIVKNYPNSQYVNDSKHRLIFLKNRIAAYELSVIKFYYERHAYISVIKRSEKMLRYFSDTQSALEALHYMQQSYQAIHLPNQAKKINKIIIENSTTH